MVITVVNMSLTKPKLILNCSFIISINQKKFLESLVSFGIPRKIERLVKMTLEGAQAKVIVGGKISNTFLIRYKG